jgi:hypothetical protein
MKLIVGDWGVLTVSNILVKQISVATTDYAPVTVMCNPAAVSLACLTFWSIVRNELS